MDNRYPRANSPYSSSANRPPAYKPSYAPSGTQMRVGKSLNNFMALSNYVYVAPGAFDRDVHYIMVDDQFVFTIRPDDQIQPGTLAFSNPHRKWAGLSLNQGVFVQPYDPFSEGADIYNGKMELEVGFLARNTAITDPFDTEEMARAFCSTFNNQIFTIGQSLAFEFKGNNLAITVKNLTTIHIDALRNGLTGERAPENNRRALRGILTQQTAITFVKAPDSSIRLTGSSRVTQANVLVRPDFKFESMGIGGLDEEFSAVFRRAFASRIFPSTLVEKLGIQHVRGILLYGPPGTGKTLMARQIGKMLNAREPIVVNGPEILNKYVGQSEENVRKLFAEAEKEYKQKGDDSSLHIIIFDELDAICRQRGGRADSTGVGDSVVNQLLAKLDGVEQLNNILIIGMTNRLDMIDEALLRPGRLEVHIEVGLPDEKGRQQILKIHTAKMRENNIMAPDVNLEELASLTKNYSGAEIAGIVKSASSFAFNRHVKVGTLAGVAPDVENMKVQRADFLLALEEVKPAFGVSDTELQQCVQNHIIPFQPEVESILNDGQLFVEQVKNSQRTPLVSVLLHGPPSSGKTALAASIAMASEFPFVKLISPESMVGYSESAKISAINKVFSDSYKSPQSVIVIDNLERILEWTPIGPRFSNAVLQALIVLLNKRPPKERRLLILATTAERSILEQMGMQEAFSASVHVPNITSLKAVEIVLRELGAFTDDERQRAMVLLRQHNLDRLNIGIKKLLMVIEMARQDVDKVDKFVNTLLGI
ncbi:uncharacterized protein VTP21DRAFT_9344 [Calcarisporiella thermophila]|uniref:uncharacterized protein n=1 Tax=Calcarisporiella thermophila TaxID=911321 RepID=UPI003743F262